MSDQSSGCPICRDHGCAVSGIIARETSLGQFSGSTSAVGIGGGGVSVSGGTIRGTTSSASLLAQQLACPSVAAEEPINPHWGMVLMGSLMVFFSIMFPRVFDALSAGSGTPVIDLTTFLGWLPCLLVGTGLSIVVYSLFRAVCYEPNQMQTTAYEEQLQLSLQIPILYERLRYCAADHRVFDPATQRMCHPDQDKIRTMLVDIALQADEKDQAPVT